MAATISRQAVGASRDQNKLTPRDQNKPHLAYLDGMRACAAVFVVMCHCWFTAWLHKTDAPPLWTHWLYYGRFAVDVFIVLSGFCLMLPVVRGDGRLRGGTGLFLQKRARRILPPYYLTVAFSILLDFVLIGHSTGSLWDETLPLTWHSVVTHLLLLQNFSGTELHKINYVLWSISLEWWIYFLFPGLVWAWKQFGAGKTVLLAVVATFLLCQVCGHFFHDNFTLYYINLFVFGMLGAEIAYTRRPAIRSLRDRLRWDVLTSAALLLTAAAMTGRVPHFSSTNVVDSLVGLSAVCLLVTTSLHPASLISRVLSQKPMMFVGSFAYSIYLVHAPLLQIFWRCVLSPLRLTSMQTFFALEIIGVPLIVGAAYLFHLAFERPFMTKPGVKIKTEAQAEAAAIVNPAP